MPPTEQLLFEKVQRKPTVIFAVSSSYWKQNIIWSQHTSMLFFFPRNICLTKNWLRIKKCFLCRHRFSKIKHSQIKHFVNKLYIKPRALKCLKIKVLYERHWFMGRFLDWHKLNWKCETGGSVLMWFWKMTCTLDRYKGRMQICLHRGMCCCWEARGDVNFWVKVIVKVNQRPCERTTCF